MSPISARRAVVLVLATALAAPLTVGLGTAHANSATIPLAPVAATPAANGLISYQGDVSKIFVAKPDGTGHRAVKDHAFGAPGWSPDGSRFAYRSVAGIRSARADGTGDFLLAEADGYFPAWSQDGSLIFYNDGTGGDRTGRIHFVTADGAFDSPPLFDPGPSCRDAQPTVAPDGDLVFQRLCDGADPKLIRRDLETGGFTEVVPRGSEPDFSPDGTKLAYTTRNETTGEVEIWTADADGGNQQLLVAGAHKPSWSPDGLWILYLARDELSPGDPIRQILLATKHVRPLDLRGDEVSWQPLRLNSVTRVWGQDHIDTGIATSRYNYANPADPNDSRAVAKSVVLSRDDTFLDALVGSAFAVTQPAPLLVTNRAALDPRVEREIQRVLGATGNVFLLGGEQALAPAVANRLTSLGYTVHRISGQTHFDTAIEINKKITPAPKTAIVTTGINFYDALAAGAAAGANPETVIVLTNGTQMPDSSANYLNGLNPDFTAENGTAIVTAGGPGDIALREAHFRGQMPSWPSGIDYFPLVGENEKDTALLIARGFFSAPGAAAVATNRTWFDALTGGAMIGFANGPLLITDPTALYGDVFTYLSENSGSIWTGVLLGGPAALGDMMIGHIGDTISQSGHWRYSEVTPTRAEPTGRARTTVHAARTAHTGPGLVGGAPVPISR